MGCLNCGRDLTQLDGKREKLYCNSTCRSYHFQRKKKLGFNPEFFAKKREGKLPKKETVNVPEIELTFMGILNYTKGGGGRGEIEAAISAHGRLTSAQQDIIRRKIKD